jgi:hypothetical protein
MVSHGQQDNHLANEVCKSNGPNGPMSNSQMMNSNGNINSQLFPNVPPPATPPFPLQVAYDLSNNMKRKDLFTQRKQREFIPDNKKDDSYWDRRRRNNEAAKRSREKRRFNDMVLEQRVLELTKENHVLKAQLHAIKDKFGINGDNLIILEQVLATLPSNEQLLSFSKRTKVYPSGFGKGGNQASPSSSEHSGRDRRDSSGDMSPERERYGNHIGDERSRSPFQHSMSGHGHHGGPQPPVIEIEKQRNGVEHHSAYNIGPDGFNHHSKNNHSDNLRSNQSSLSPSENILNLSISSSQSSENLDQDDSINSDSEECRPIPNGEGIYFT